MQKITVGADVELDDTIEYLVFYNGKHADISVTCMTTNDMQHLFYNTPRTQSDFSKKYQDKIIKLKDHNEYVYVDEEGWENTYWFAI